MTVITDRSYYPSDGFKASPPPSVLTIIVPDWLRENLDDVKEGVEALLDFDKLKKRISIGDIYNLLLIQSLRLPALSFEHLEAGASDLYLQWTAKKCIDEIPDLPFSESKLPFLAGNGEPLKSNEDKKEYVYDLFKLNSNTNLDLTSPNQISIGIGDIHEAAFKVETIFDKKKVEYLRGKGNEYFSKDEIIRLADKKTIVFVVTINSDFYKMLDTHINLSDNSPTFQLVETIVKQLYEHLPIDQVVGLPIVRYYAKLINRKNVLETL